MSSCDALFPRLLGSEWDALALPVQRMHGDAAHLSARGVANVTGAANPATRLLRHILGLPQPGPSQPLEFSIQRDRAREIWTRRFGNSQMRSVLDRADSQLRERLGPVTFRFALHRDQDAISWHLCSGAFLGLRMPQWLLGRVISRSGCENGRYTFHVDAQLPLVGQLVSYRGWLEIIDG